MPEMDGYETSRKIREGAAGETYTGIPILAMTANAMKGDQDKCVNTGMSDYLTKPIDPDILAEKLQIFLDKPNRNNALLDGKHLDKPKASLVTWDRDSALRRVRNKVDRLVRLVSMFLNGIPERIESLSHAVEKNDISDSAAIAHGIKGVAANLGAEELADATKKIEEAGYRGDSAFLRQGWPHVDESYKKVVVQLKSYLQQHRPQ